MTGQGAAVLFDIDGTLVDSNYLHVHAWYRAFQEAGCAVEAWRIHRLIGMDGTTLVETLTPDADTATREQAKDLHSRYYKESAPYLKRLPGARELLEAVHKLGVQVVLATSAPEDELAVLREVLDSDHLVSAVTSSEDVDTAKPKPDIVNVALERAGVVAAHAVFVGDSVWDMEACARAGVDSLGVLSGGVSRDELETAGAQRVFEHPKELCQHLDDTPIAALANIVGAR
ncbi:haloacid dehalogenase superfamily, subfamily IA, variant 3 with third motif having DD or ED/haloacid dehalogenase superfamily, subfamily IA, variant 1 with third motif having Dx(3-4)D or Dx(3-4)E [Mycolicibacterium rutilum]|uniref:Haloacid dehalogenase superfamily, subfamily IA, variant 3 with third motif having DD or ED/haloacid dehalogenase superfamily, subfamily IA, variant 1 with third motif having Dx(3-4)D or Dx(3-4)E n=1 Tax=Mycolicibacterium rutilum TaxID=370526 RepID=A0A1H6L1A4_MYCRU|nr:HAD family hydrolase [Mycolicibacterium rutilum]SEH77966.1 haloacid dehalogenase superfamily, subfamily IA, variant 3 with third motif having DD or ED/haloacid dehalogenase superfamily, subfamily IA, variant 1 with third motif having Dx(3-4)D or Dx(3-4)E [Mycolicibacterium rutilum]